MREPAVIETFDRLRLSERALAAVHALGWRAPTPIQSLALPHLLTGKDVLAQAVTGSGKTGAFGLTLSEGLAGPGLKGLVLVPTRELAVQVSRDVNALALGARFRAEPIYGGVAYEPQVAAMRDPETTVLVATTGRLLDFVNRGIVDLSTVTVVVIDEADRMLDYGFLPDVKRILQRVPKGRQTALFSATLPKEVRALAREYMANPREVRPATEGPMPDTARHFRVDCSSAVKQRALLGLLAKEEPESVIVFARTREGARDLAKRLRQAGVECAAIHGDLAQDGRERVLARFRAGEIRILVATDVAARGLDIFGVTHVVNFDAPEEPDAYVHRAGRTARAGRGGRVFTLVSEKDHDRVKRAFQEARVRPIEYELGTLPPDPWTPAHAGGAKPAPREPARAKSEPETATEPETEPASAIDRALAKHRGGTLTKKLDDAKRAPPSTQTRGPRTRARRDGRQ